MLFNINYFNICFLIEGSNDSYDFAISINLIESQNSSLVGCKNDNDFDTNKRG